MAVSLPTARELQDEEPRAVYSRPSSGQAWLLVSLAGLAFLLRVSGLDFQSLWRDEVDAVRFAQQPLREVLAIFASPGQNGPLYYLLLRPWLALAGSGEFALRFFSAAAGLPAVPLMARLARRLFPGRPALALLAALLAAVSPYLVWYSQEGKMYALVVTLVLLAMDRYLAALAAGGWHRWLLAVLLTSASLYVHLVTALMIPVQIVAFALQPAAARRARWRPWLASMAVLIVPYLPLLAWQLPLLREAGASGYPFVPLPEMALSLLSGFGLGVIQGATPWAVALLLVPLLLSGLLWREGPAAARSWAILVAWLVLPVLGFFAITLLRPMYTARYLIFCLPAYLLLLAAGLQAVARRSRPVGAVLAVALLALSGWGVWLQARTPLKADVRAATAHLVAGLAPGDLVIFQIPYTRHAFDYYQARPALLRRPAAAGDGPGPGRRFRLFLPLAHRPAGPAPYRWADGLYTNGGLTPFEVDRRMAEITAGSRVVWLVASEVSLWDERGLVQDWLERHAAGRQASDFVRVSVVRYELQAAGAGGLTSAGRCAIIRPVPNAEVWYR